MDKKKGGKPKLPALHIKFRQAQLAVTVIVPSIPGWIVHAKGYFPGVVNSTNQCAPGYSPWEVVERAVWFAIVTLCVIEFDAGFVNSTICPTFTVTAAGAHCSVSDALMMATGVPARWVPAFPALSDCTALLDDELLDDELETARVLGLAPFGAVATLRGEEAAAFASALDGERVRVSVGAQGVVVRADDVETLLDALNVRSRPASLRVAVE